MIVATMFRCSSIGSGRSSVPLFLRYNGMVGVGKDTGVPCLRPSPLLDLKKIRLGWWIPAETVALTVRNAGHELAVMLGARGSLISRHLAAQAKLYCCADSGTTGLLVFLTFITNHPNFKNLSCRPWRRDTF